ncbi:MAG TPA: hypothetical protein VGD50_00515, partial [Candidatus Baltobacteraceae bacterium]
LFTFAARKPKPAMLFVHEGLAGLGAGLCYLSLWAGVSYFQIAPRGVGLVAMIGVTAALALLAFVRRSERLGVMGLIGAY